MAKKKNSLVGNINRRKQEGTSRTKEDSTISPKAYKEMQQGWPKAGKKKEQEKKEQRAKPAAA